MVSRLLSLQAPDFLDQTLVEDDYGVRHSHARPVIRISLVALTTEGTNMTMIILRSSRISRLKSEVVWFVNVGWLFVLQLRLFWETCRCVYKNGLRCNSLTSFIRRLKHSPFSGLSLRPKVVDPHRTRVVEQYERIYDPRWRSVPPARHCHADHRAVLHIPAETWHQVLDTQRDHVS